MVTPTGDLDDMPIGAELKRALSRLVIRAQRAGSHCGSISMDRRVRASVVPLRRWQAGRPVAIGRGSSAVPWPRYRLRAGAQAHVPRSLVPGRHPVSRWAWTHCAVMAGPSSISACCRPGRECRDHHSGRRTAMGAQRARPHRRDRRAVSHPQFCTTPGMLAGQPGRGGDHP